MAANAIEIGVVLVLVTLFCEGAVAQLSCTRVVISLSPCLNYVTGNSPSTGPSSSCCSQLTNVVQSQPQCLCSVLDGGASSSLGITINQTRALSLPTACNVHTPPVSCCNTGGNAPTTSPAAGTSDDQTPQSPTTSPRTPKVSSRSCNRGTASRADLREDGTSNGNTMKVAPRFSIFLLFALSCAF